MGRNAVQRTLIHQTVCWMHHPTADEVYAEMQKSYPDIGRATVYRNLKVLSKEGKLRRISLSDGADRFDHCLEHHHHLACSRCGECKDIWEKILLPEAKGPFIWAVAGWRAIPFIFTGSVPSVWRERLNRPPENGENIVIIMPEGISIKLQKKGECYYGRSERNQNRSESSCCICRRIPGAE